MIEHELFICKCENTEHQLIFSYFPEDEEDREIYVSVNLLPEYNIFKRIWTGLKYIFGHRSIYGYFDEFIFKQSDSHKLIKILKYLDPNISIVKSENSRQWLIYSTIKFLSLQSVR